LLLHVRLDRHPDLLVRVVVPSDTRIGVDTILGVQLRRDRLHRFDAATGRAVAPGTRGPADAKRA
jgi:hypothetical protein